MLRAPFITIVCALALATLACGLTVKLPMDQVVTGPTVEEEINIPAPDESPVNLKISFAAGNLSIDPGAEDALVTGTATYNVSDFKPQVTTKEGQVILETGNLEIEGIPSLSGDIKNKWKLELGEQPMNLDIEAGAYEGDLNLGGLALESLAVSDGAASVRLKFSEPNKTEMSIMRYQTGASNVRLQELGNANFASLIFRSGAGDYLLDFSGEWQRSAVVTIESGISQLVLVVPEEISARVVFNGGLTSVKTSGGWERSGGAYVLGDGDPLLTITVDMGAGNLELRAK
jgi:hypothetical protein